MKTWIKTEVYNHCEQVMSIEPGEDFSCIQLSVAEVDGSSSYERFYINKEELKTIIFKLQEMMDYVTKTEE